MIDLWHYTCSHSRAELGDEGVLLPTADRADVSRLGINAWPSFFVWVTDMAEPEPNALGLTRNHIRCDRTEHRYWVTDASDIVPWQHVLDTDPGYASVASLLLSPGADPSRWFVSSGPVPVAYDPLPVAPLFLPEPYEESDLANVSRIVAERWSKP